MIININGMITCVYCGKEFESHFGDIVFKNYTTKCPHCHKTIGVSSELMHISFKLIKDES
jgi:hypothetical protein